MSWPFKRQPAYPPPIVVTTVRRRTDVALWKSTFLLISHSSEGHLNSVMTHADGYVERLPIATSDHELGLGVLRALDHEIGPLVRPNYRSNPPPRTPIDDLLDELGVTQRVFDKTGVHSAVYRNGDEISIARFVYEKGCLIGPDDNLVLPLTVDPETLGRAVRAALTAVPTATPTAAPTRARKPTPPARRASRNGEGADASAPHVDLNPGDPAALAAFLRASDLWAGLSDADQDEHEGAVAAGGYPLNEGVPCYFADGEELSEGGVLDLLAELAPALAEHGLVVDAHEVVAADQTYTISINGVNCVVLPDADERDWYGATMRPLQVVNDLLAEAGASVRVFVAYPGGNEGLAFLLDPRVPAAMRASGLFEARDLPVLAHHDR